MVENSGIRAITPETSDWTCKILIVDLCRLGESKGKEIKYLNVISQYEQGAFTHQDFAGHKGTITTGNVQWVTAGRGITHFLIFRLDSRIALEKFATFRKREVH